MIKQELNKQTERQWRMLLIYNIYRVFSIVVLFSLHAVNLSTRFQDNYYNLALLVYLIFGLVFLYFCLHSTFKFETQVLFAGTIDIVVLVILIDSIGYLESGLGLLLYATVAVLSILTPGRLAVFFASVTSFMLLLITVARYEFGAQHDLTPFFTTGIYCSGFFATALTVWYLASWVRANEMLAEKRGNEITSILRVGEFFVEQLKYGLIYVESNGLVRLMNSSARQRFNIRKNSLPCLLEEISLSLFNKYRVFVTASKRRNKYAQSTMTEFNLQVQFFSASIDSQTSVLIILEDLASIEQQAQQFKLASLGRFSASIAHELRNPLGIISHATQLMAENTSLNEEGRRLKELIENNCHRMNQVIKNVLQLSRRNPVVSEQIELASFLKLFKDEYSLINRVNIIIKVPQNKKRTIFFDKSQLDQIMVILCDNAVQHGRDAKGEVHITISVMTVGNRLQLHLSDTGPGIPKSRRDQVFEPFFTTLITGNGMGLFIAKDLCEMNGARLQLVDVNQGCCFSILFNHIDGLRL